MDSSTDTDRRPTGTYPERQRALLLDARRRNDTDAERRVCHRLDDEFVARAHLRAADPEVRRLRRLVRSGDPLPARSAPTSPSSFGLSAVELVAEANRLRAAGWSAQEVGARLARPSLVPQQREGGQ